MDRDEAIETEWQAWQRRRGALGTNAATGGDTAQIKSSASIVNAAFAGKRVSLDDLENEPTAYIGQKVSVDGEVDQVLGPRLFTLDEPGWVDLEGELLVYMPAPLAALVRENDSVTISGTVRSFVEVDVEREWGWPTLSQEVEIDLGKKPVIVAERIIGGDSQRALIVTAGSGSPDRTVSTTGADLANSPPPITTSAALALADEETVGRRVELNRVTVTGLADRGGFFVAAQEHQLFVFPHDARLRQPLVGEMVSIDGTILQLPDRLRSRLKAPGAMNHSVYVFADRID